MKKYEFPQLKVNKFDIEDVLCESKIVNGGTGSDIVEEVNPSNPEDIFGRNSTGVSAFN